VNQPYLNRGLNLNRRSNSLNSATDVINFLCFKFFYRELLFLLSYQLSLKNFPVLIFFLISQQKLILSEPLSLQ